MKVAGHELSITPATWAEATALKTAVANALKRSKLDLSGLEMGGLKEDLANLGEDASEIDLGRMSGPVNSLVSLICNLETSDDVRSALFTCAARTNITIGAERFKVTEDFFEKMEHRELYYPIMIEVLKFNLSPFFKNLGSMFPGLGAGIASILKSR